MKKRAFIWIGLSAIFLGPMFLIACTRQKGGNAFSRSLKRTSSGGMMGMMGSGSMQVMPNGIRTITESRNPRVTALLQVHVASMYERVAAAEEVRCMSSSLPIMFRNANRYRRHLRLTPTGIAVEETSSDPVLVRAIHRHAQEVTGFVTEGMPAMMRTMMR